MGAGILPTTVKNGKIHFLFGKENKFEKSAPGFSDFGGGSEKDETPLDTAIREGGEELTGFLGSDDQLRKMLTASDAYTIDLQNGKYRTHIFYMKYDPYLEKYYNNNQKFIQKRLDPTVIKTSKIFEKAEIRWICIDDLEKMRPKFRHFFAPIVDKILNDRDTIESLVKSNNGTRKSR
ncbi:MAG: NUDIX domain-containing protein [Flavobacterium sp.]